MMKHHMMVILIMNHMNLGLVVGKRSGSGWIYGLETPLLQITPRLFSYTIDKNANVTTYFPRVGSSIVCAAIFRRNPLEEKEFQLLYMLVELEAVYISVSGKDRRVWAMSTDGSFTFSSFFKSPVERPSVASLGVACGISRPLQGLGLRLECSTQGNLIYRQS